MYEIITLFNDKRQCFGILNNDGILQRLDSKSTNITIKESQDKFKDQTIELSDSAKKGIMSSWYVSKCDDYDFILTYCSLFTIQTFDTLSQRIFVPSRKKRISRWGVGKRVYETMRTARENGSINIDFEERNNN